MKTIRQKITGWEILSVPLFVAAWEATARLAVQPGQFFFPPFSAVMPEFYHLTVSGVLIESFSSSLLRVDRKSVV